MKPLLITLSLIASCLFAAAQGKYVPAKTVMEARYGKTLVLNESTGSLYAEEKEAKQGVVFEWNYTSGQHEAVADDELKEIIGFQFTPDKTGKFTLSGQEQLEAANAYFYRGCFCSERGTFRIVDGTIRAVRMSKQIWYVNGTVQVKTKQGLITKTVKGTFRIIPAQ